LRADADTALIQGFDGDLISLPWLAQHVGRGYLAIFEDDLAGGRGANAELVLFFANRESRHTLVHQEGGDPFISSARIQGCEDDEEAGLTGIGDKELLPVQQIEVAALFGPHLERERIRTGAGFTQGVRTHGVGREPG